MLCRMPLSPDCEILLRSTRPRRSRLRLRDWPRYCTGIRRQRMW
ncbi:Uncharacterised protein [Mycobacteroides abscessus subsp. abscessus]|nr:Uncharacterised protein [Mycobacteroides abscessus subsp. abscessus]